MNYSQMKSAVSGIEIPRMAALKAEKEAYEPVKNRPYILKTESKQLSISETDTIYVSFRNILRT